MFVGHGVLAFVIVAWLARALGRPVREAVALGLLAAAFGTLPDVDMLYAPLGLLSGVGSVAGASAAFWESAASVHRTATHSLVVGALATIAVAAWQPHSRRPAGRVPTAGLSSLIPAAVAALLVLVAAETGGLVGALIVAVFLGGALGLTTLALRADLPRRWIVVGAGVGLLTHPFGDLLTGTPPGLLYPFDLALLDGRIVLASDPTVNLLAVFFVELAVIWAGLFTVARFQEWRLGWRVHPGAALGVGYAPILVAVPTPSIDAAAPFVVTVLAVGLVGAPLAVRNRDGRWWDAVVTATSAVTVAGLAYLLAYIAV
ncbi:MAG: metal-dependent hydrolase [Haloarculaceae archaeon]